LIQLAPRRVGIDPLKNVAVRTRVLWKFGLSEESPRSAQVAAFVSSIICCLAPRQRHDCCNLATHRLQDLLQQSIWMSSIKRPDNGSSKRCDQKASTASIARDQNVQAKALLFAIGR
jgi:hypothetical protein